MRRTLGIVSVLIVIGCLAWAQAPQAPQAQGQQGQAAGQAAADAGRGGRAGRPPLTPQIRNFQATPAAIKPGESFVLSWSTESGQGTIDNGIGSIPNRGTIKVTPKATTTYTLSMGGGAVTRSITVTVAGTTPITSTPGDQPAAAKPIPRIDGKPDFSGVYGFGGVGRGAGGAGAAPPQPPASPYANLPTQPTLKPGVQNRGAAANPSGGTADCLPLPADTAFGVPYPFQIFQNKNYVILINEYPGTFRIVPMDDPHPADPDPTWMGDSVGRWEGDTLIIDTVAYNGKHAIGGIQQPSEKFHTIERLTRTSATGIFYEIIYEDPEFATGQWRATRTFNANTNAGVNKIMEFVCENNRDYTPLFGPGGPPPPQEGGRGGRGQRGGAQGQRQ
jgi:hypothetical protein